MEVLRVIDHNSLEEAVELLVIDAMGSLDALLSGQFRLGGTRRDAAREQIEKSSEGHIGHTLTWVISGSVTMMLTDLPIEMGCGWADVDVTNALIEDVPPKSCQFYS